MSCACKFCLQSDKHKISVNDFSVVFIGFVFDKLRYYINEFWLELLHHCEGIIKKITEYFYADYSTGFFVDDYFLMQKHLL